jgi:hypothetical protein
MTREALHRSEIRSSIEKVGDEGATRRSCGVKNRDATRIVPSAPNPAPAGAAKTREETKRASALRDHE